MSDRRTFLKQSCGLCASILGIGLVLPALNSCASIATIDANLSHGTIDIPLQNFAADNNLVLVKNKALEFDIAIVKLGEGDFKAFKLECSHQSNPLIPTKSGFFCNAHGSSFSFEGKAMKAPAQNPLQEFKLELNGDHLVLRV
jgi:Rieske Fe-S protein